MSQKQYSAVIVGTGFASTFFLLEYLKHARANERILVLERGNRIDYATRLKTRKNSDIRFDDLIINRTPQKPWVQNIAFGGGSCWTGNTPRMHPNDFRTRSLYGVGIDWPLSYSDLEPYYAMAEELMGVGGASIGPYPRSKPYAYPAHRFNAFDEIIAKIKSAYPDLNVHKFDNPEKNIVFPVLQFTE